MNLLFYPFEGIKQVNIVPHNKPIKAALKKQRGLLGTLLPLHISS